MNRNKFRTLVGVTLTVIASAGASLLMNPQTADASETAMACNNMACYGPNTCERHQGGDCDLYNPAVPNGCVTNGCN